jgi:hypothetical protein
MAGAGHLCRAATACGRFLCAKSLVWARVRHRIHMHKMGAAPKHRANFQCTARFCVACNCCANSGRAADFLRRSNCCVKSSVWLLWLSKPRAALLQATVHCKLLYLAQGCCVSILCAVLFPHSVALLRLCRLCTAVHTGSWVVTVQNRSARRPGLAHGNVLSRQAETSEASSCVGICS